jgi:hypothetical protein
MYRWCVYLFGVFLIAVALAAVPSVAIVTSYVGGSAVDGHVEDGRYFVNPSHGQPIVEVSKSTWRAVYCVERLWPWSILFTGLPGLFFTTYAFGPNWKPSPVPPAEPPHWVLYACMIGVAITLGGAGLCWAATHAPWAVMLVGWILAWVCGATVARLWSRSFHQQATAKKNAARDAARR